MDDASEYVFNEVAAGRIGCVCTAPGNGHPMLNQKRHCSAVVGHDTATRQALLYNPRGATTNAAGQDVPAVIRMGAADIAHNFAYAVSAY